MSTTPVDIAPLCIKCDVAVLNGGHDSVSTFLRGGVPMLLIPMMLEQQVTADRLADHGLGLHAPPIDFDAIGTSLQSLLQEPAYGDNARGFARQLPTADEPVAIAQLVDNLQSELLC